MTTYERELSGASEKSRNYTSAATRKFVRPHGAQPVFHAPHPVPYALIPHVDAKLNELEKQGIITKTDYCGWGTPLVIAPKPDGDLRICADYSIMVNKVLEPNNFPIPIVDELFTKIHGSSYFCVLEIANVYLHIKLDEESSKIAAISTHCKSFIFWLKCRTG